MQRTNIRMAVVQASPHYGDNAEAIDRAWNLARSAAGQGAHVVVFPECFLPGYPHQLDPGIEGSASGEARAQLLQEFASRALDDASPELAQVSRIAKDNNVYLSMGISESDGSQIYCTNYLWNNDGQLVGKHRKLRPTGFERDFWTSEDGSNLSAFDTPYGTLGFSICWESYLPLLRAALYAKGTQVLVIPAADSSEQWQATLRHIALEGRCYVVSCCHFADGVDESRSPRPKCGGGSAIVDPDGNYVAGPLFGSERTLYADLDLTRTRKGLYDFDEIPLETRKSLADSAVQYGY